MSNPGFHRILKSVTPPAAIVDNAAFTTAEIDSVDATYGKASFLNFVAYFGATDIAAAVFKVTSSDTSGSGHADISGADFSVSPLTLPSATDDNTFYEVFINLRNNHKRYFDLSVTGGDGAAGTFMAAWAELWYPTIQPITAAGLNVTQYASV